MRFTCHLHYSGCIPSDLQRTFWLSGRTPHCPRTHTVSAKAVVRMTANNVINSAQPHAGLLIKHRQTLRGSTNDG